MIGVIPVFDATLILQVVSMVVWLILLLQGFAFWGLVCVGWVWGIPVAT